MTIHYDDLPVELLAYGMPIYASTDRGNPMMVGSSILGKLNGIHFLITAAHVIDDFIHQHPSILAPDRSSFLPLAKLRSKASSESFDLYIAELDGEYLEETLKWRQFIDLRALNRDPAATLISVGASVGFVGYPVSKNSIPDRGVSSPVIPQPKGYLITCEHAQPGNPSYCGFDPKERIVADFSRRKYQKTDGTRVFPPEPCGMSGGGVWLLCGEDRDEMTISHYHLVGVGFKWHNNHTLVATRLEHIFSALKVYWPNAILA